MGVAKGILLTIDPRPALGSRICVHHPRRSYMASGTLVYVCPAGERFPVKAAIEYYAVSWCQALEHTLPRGVDRFVIRKDGGGYAIVPMTPHYTFEVEGAA